MMEYRAKLLDGRVMGYKADYIAELAKTIQLPSAPAESTYTRMLRLLRKVTGEQIVSFELVDYNAPAEQPVTASNGSGSIQLGMVFLLLSAVGLMILAIMQ